MTIIAAETTEVTYVADGVETEFEVTFKWYETSEIKVYLDGALQSSGYSVTHTPATTLNDSYVYTKVVFDTAPANLVEVRLAQDINSEQQIDWIQASEAIEKGFDKLTLKIRSMLESANRGRQSDRSGSAGDGYGLIVGAVDGVNSTFTVSRGKYESGSLKVYYLGQRVDGVTETTPASGVFTMPFPPKTATGNEVIVDYEYEL